MIFNSITKGANEGMKAACEGMKAACEDGKLTDSEIEALGALLLEKALAQISEPAKNLLAAAGKDITAIIQDAGEALIGQMKKAG